MNDEVVAQSAQIPHDPPGPKSGTRTFDRGEACRLRNLAPHVPESRRFSGIFRGRGELVDLIFASRFLFNNNQSQPVEAVQADLNASGDQLGSGDAAVLAPLSY